MTDAGVPSSPQMQSTPEQITEWLIDECRDVGNRVTELLMVGERVLATTCALLAIASTVALGSGQGHWLMALPFAISSILVYMLFLNNEAMSQGGYREALEVEIQRRTGFPVSQWESLSSRIRNNKVQVNWTVGGMGSAQLLVSVVAIQQALATRSAHHWGHERGFGM